MLPVFAILFAFFPVRAAPCQCKPASLCLPLDIPPRKEIFAFYVPSSGPWNQLNWTELTTVVIFGSVDPNIVCYAHERRVRVVTGEDFDHSQLGNATARQEWVTSKIQSTRDAGLDGINFDIEGNAANRDGLTALVSLSYNRFKSELPGSQVTFDTSIDASANSPGYDYAALANYTDFVVPMGYDMCWGTKTGEPNSPLAGLEHGLSTYYQLGVRPQSLVLGLPWYGYDFPCQNPPRASTPCSVETPFGGGAWQKCFNEIQDLFKTNATSPLYKTPEGDAVYFNYESTIDKKTHQVWFDDPATLMLKYATAKTDNLRGVAFWHASCAGDSAAMWSALSSFL
eukprot:TRINITY_DN3960_c0_g1_i1.p1 TRINITY_DN3960_c0_g1~~TRINITY_DN3960_c0_g1_i1.p1  ORF type:complete len:341 (-),score=37.58 TRINITY_DN3960_c0_g1_i1:4-1026(-)